MCLDFKIDIFFGKILLNNYIVVSTSYFTSEKHRKMNMILLNPKNPNNVFLTILPEEAVMKKRN